MDERLHPIPKKVWLDLKTMSGPQRSARLRSIIGLTYTVPLALVGVVWLLSVTDLQRLRLAWPTLALLFVLGWLLRQRWFFLIIHLKPRRLFDFGSSLATIVVWSAALLFGPSALWLEVLWVALSLARNWWQARTLEARWSHLQNFTLNLSGATLPPLVALDLYESWGGVFPLPSLVLADVLPALFATLVRATLLGLGWAPLVGLHVRAQVGALTHRPVWLRLLTGILLFGIALPAVIDSFAILAAGLYTLAGLGAYLFLMTGVLLANLLAHQLSRAAARNWERSRELERLEQLGRAIIHGPPDASTLPDVLREHVLQMFPATQIEIRIFPAHILLHEPPNWPMVAAPIWEWLHATAAPRCFLPGEAVPWDQRPASDALLIVPIIDVEGRTPIGGIYLARHHLQFWDPHALANTLPAVQSLAAYIATARHAAEVYARTLAQQRVAQELALAWQIQASLLPQVLPDIAGWHITAALDPARETSGDFYDCIPLPNGCWGLVVADVADKGLGPALYMTMTRTLIRTYAVEHPTRPELVLSAVNHRILIDTDATWFVTVFYGILDPSAGMLRYCNAGHNPPYLLSARNPDTLQALSRTGLPLGIAEDLAWQQQAVTLAPGDVVVLYSDGVTEAQDRHAAFFGTERLLAVVRANMGCAVQELQEAILTQVHAFVGDAPQADDITLMLVQREEQCSRTTLKLEASTGKRSALPGKTA